MVDAEDIGPTIEQAVGQAIESVVREHEQGFVTKWIALVESVSPEGERGLWTLTSAYAYDYSVGPDCDMMRAVGLVKCSSDLMDRHVRGCADD